MKQLFKAMFDAGGGIKQIRKMLLVLVMLMSVNMMADVAPVNTILWGENFAHFDTNTPSSAGTGTGTTIYDGASISYSQSNNNTKGYNEKLASGTAPELMLAKKTSSTTASNWVISGIKSGNAKEMNLSFKSNKTSGVSFSVSSTAYDVSGSFGNWTLKLKEGNSAPATFNITLDNTTTGTNVRIDDVVLKVTKAGEAGGCTSTLTAPEVVATPGDKQIVLTWDAVTNATGYKIFKNTAEVGTTTNTTYTLTGLTNKTSYAWQVVAIGNGTTICDSEPASGNATPNAVYTLNYFIAGEAGSVNATDGSNIVASLPLSPTSCSLESNAFQGWTTAGSVLADGSDFIPVSGNVDATAASKTYTAVWAKETIGEEKSICGGTFSDGVGSTGWSSDGTGTYSGNGLKFDGEGDSIYTKDLSSKKAKSVTVKMKAGHNGGSGSVFTISAWSQSGKLIDSKTCQPTDAYTSQTTVYEYTLSGSETIAKVSVKLTSKTKNMGMKYCEVFAKEVTCSKYITYCCDEHNVTLTDNGTKTGGSFSADIVKACEGTKITLSYNEATGYEFKGWTITPNTVEINENNEFYMPNENVTIDASFDLIPYSITYNLDGGSWSGEAGVATYTYGIGATLPTAENITKANNTFEGWYSEEKSAIITSIETTETGNKSLTAIWTPASAKTVTINGDSKLTYTSLKPTVVDKDAESLTVTYSVNKGYTISAVAVTVNDAALTESEVVFNDEQLTITPNGGFTGNVAITFTVVEKMFTVTWMANKTQFKQVQIQEGSKVSLPVETPSDVISGEDTYKFQGWFTEEQYSNETTAPTYIKDNDIEPTGDVTYYAVYAMKESSIVANSYVKGSKSDLTEGQKVIIVNGNSKKALSSENLSGAQTTYRKAIGVTITNNKISNTNANIVWTVSLENSKYIFKQGTNYLNSTGNNLYCDEDEDTWTITEVSGNAGYTLKSTNGEKYLEYYSDYTEFTCYTGGSGNAFNMNFYIPEVTETTKNYRTRVAVIDHIAVHEAPLSPERTNLVAGETFDATGLSIDVYYQGEDAPTNVTSGFTYAPNGTLATSNDKITFTYQGKTADVAISVSNTVSGIEVTTNPSKTVYNEGEQFKPAGMEVTATYGNTAKRVVTGYTYEPKGDLALDDKITISFGGQTTELGITIHPVQKTTVNWYVEGVKLTEGGQSTAVIPGKKITALPSEPAACQGNQFVGWTTDEDYYNATTAPDDLFKTLAEVPTIGETETNFYAVFASEAVGTYDEKVTLTSLTAPTADKFTYAFAKLPSGTSNPSWNAEQAKTYVKNTLTVTSKNNRVITKIEYTYNINSGGSGTAPTGATVTGNNSDNGSWDSTNKTWTSSTNAATAVTLTVNGSSGNYGFTAIKVYLTGGTVLSDYSTTCLAALANPTITTDEGEYCGSVDVEITQPDGNPVGAQIMYSTDNTNWTPYESAVKLTTSGTIYAKVVKDPKSTEVVSATYTVYPAYTLAQAAAAASATGQIACLTFTDLLVQARTQSEAFLKASDGQIVLLSKSSHGLQVGEKLVADNAHLNFIKSHDLLQLTSMDDIEKNGTGTPVADEKTITEITSANYGQLVKILNVTYDATNKKFKDASSKEIAIDAKFFVSGSLPSSWPDGGKFNATGVVVLDNNSNAVIAPRNTDDLESLATPLDKPTNFAVASVNSYRASYSWTSVDNNVGYTLYIYDGDEQIYKSNTIAKTATEYAPQKDLVAGHPYTAKLVALGDKAEHSDSPAAEVEFTTNPNAKLNWYVGDNEEPYVTYASQEKVVTPEDPESPCATNYENFVTWYTEEIDGQITALDAAKKVKAGEAAASATTEQVYNFYAVFGKVQKAGTDKYVKVTESQDNWKGEYLIGYDEGDGKDALTVFNGSLTTLDAENDYKTVSLETDGSIVANETNNSYRFNIEKSTTEGYYTIQSASGKYIANTTNSNGMSESSTTAYKNTITWAERVDIATGENATASHLSFNSASDQLRFRYYKTDKKNIVLYKREKTNPQYSGYITTCPVTYTITIANNTKGVVTAATTTEILEGAKVLLTANANAGYTKTGGNWIVKNTTTEDVVDGLVGETNYLTMPDYDVTIDYNFQEKKDQFVDNLHGNETIERGGANYELPTLSDFSGTTSKPSDAFKKFIGWSATSYDSGEPATEQPTILEGNQTATGATYFAVWSNGSGKYITEYCQTAVPTNLHLVEEYHKATSVRIDWNNVTGADMYHIIVLDGEAETIADADVTESLYDLSGLTPGATYICTVKAHKNCWSDETEEYEFTTKENIQSYAVTINAEGGTYTIDPALDEDGKIQEGKTVTISNIAVTDATIHYFKELTVPEATDLVEVEGSYMFTMPGKAVTINIVFAEFPKVTWKMAGQADIVTSSVRQDDKFVVGTVQTAPATWTFKEYYKEFAGWMTNDDVENPVFATATTEVPADGLVVNGAVAKSGKADMDNATKVTSNANLDMTAHYVIGGEKNSTSYFFSDYESVDTQLNWGLVTTDVTTAAPLVFTLSGTDSELAIQDNRGNYLVAPTKNKTITMSSTKGTVSLDATGNIKSGTSFYFRLNTSSLGVRWYNEQTVEQAYLYKVGLIYDNLTTDPSGTQIRPDAKVGMISGICYERDIVAHSGATFYYLSQKASDESYIELTEVTGILHAGYPYLFEASDNEIRVVFDGEEVQDGPYNYNGLYGTFEDTPLGDGYCIILNNKYYRTHDGNDNGCRAYRAYLKLDEVSITPVENAPGETEQPVNAPRRIRMGGDGVTTPTGWDDILKVGAELVQKLIINEKMYILRAGKMYDATGKFVK